MKQILSHGHDYMEIGGVKWATMNVGAKDVTDGGLYFAWGETKGYKPEEVGKTKRFVLGDYKFFVRNDIQLNKYNRIDNLATLQPQDDPVHANWRGGWRLPTMEEFAALNEASTSEWVDDYKGSGIAGLVLTDKNDASKQLFFPAAGRGSNWSVYYEEFVGYYWSSSLYESNPTSAWILSFDCVHVYWEDSYGRDYGFSVRGVLGD